MVWSLNLRGRATGANISTISLASALRISEVLMSALKRRLDIFSISFLAVSTPKSAEIRRSSSSSRASASIAYQKIYY